MEATKRTVFEALGLVMADLDAIKKGQKNQSQGFMFRGIDDVYNAVHPLFAKYGVIMAPSVLHSKSEDRESKSGAKSVTRVLTVAYNVYGPAGDFITMVSEGEGADFGDKATSKALSIAHKYAILQLLCIPTEDIAEPDRETIETGGKVERTRKAIMDDIAAAIAEHAMVESVKVEYRTRVANASAEDLEAILAEISKRPKGGI